MTHHEIRDKRFSFFANELLPVEMQEIRSHLATCQECSEAYAYSEAISKAFFQPIQIEPHPSFVPKVMEKIAEKTPVSSFAEFFKRHLYPAFGLLFSIALLSFAYAPQEPVAIESLVFEKVSPSFEMLLGTNTNQDWLFNREEL